MKNAGCFAGLIHSKTLLPDVRKGVHRDAKAMYTATQWRCTSRQGEGVHRGWMAVPAV